MRGKAIDSVKPSASWGITPAYAGKSILGSSFTSPYEDHPRLCGEKHMEVYAICDITGSPPPMRGKDSQTSTALLPIGITPAYAGKSFTFIDFQFEFQDHPRLCGEKFDCRCPLDSRRGSPPPMRGKGIPVFTNSICTGITPAYAGKSCCPWF